MKVGLLGNLIKDKQFIGKMLKINHDDFNGYYSEMNHPYESHKDEIRFKKYDDIHALLKEIDMIFISNECCSLSNFIKCASYHLEIIIETMIPLQNNEISLLENIEKNYPNKVYTYFMLKKMRILNEIKSLLNNDTIGNVEEISIEYNAKLENINNAIIDINSIYYWFFDNVVKVETITKYSYSNITNIKWVGNQLLFFNCEIINDINGNDLINIKIKGKNGAIEYISNRDIISVISDDEKFVIPISSNTSVYYDDSTIQLSSNINAFNIYIKSIELMKYVNIK
ncbi:hypothetical protein ACMGE7_04580 [Macrococcus equi]|uniref:hypothetical protein n=1 Tax=Macrococcus equi TaxID=3395462 RepID=UPI0039BE5590